jgi:Na+/H+ antiporter NhaA
LIAFKPMKTKLTKLFIEFFESERASGVILILCTITSIVIANSYFGKGYSDFWYTKIGFEIDGIALRYSVEHWINDGLMAIFFLLIGLEIERELYIGELSELKNATLPVFAAIGGMATPALLHFLLNRGTESQAGVGIPMATDIAFARGDEDSPSFKLQHLLHRPVAFIIMPLFALANTGIALTGNWIEGLTTSNSLGIFSGLFVGKPIGIALVSYLAVKIGLSELPSDIFWKHIIGAGFLGGVGFTMSIFITFLAFDNAEMVQSSKINILLSSIMAGAVGFLVLNRQTARISSREHSSVKRSFFKLIP